jgi:hypothetical protein
MHQGHGERTDRLEKDVGASTGLWLVAQRTLRVALVLDRQNSEIGIAHFPKRVSALWTIKVVQATYNKTQSCEFGDSSNRTNRIDL